MLTWAVIKPPLLAPSIFAFIRACPPWRVIRGLNVSVAAVERRYSYRSQRRKRRWFDLAVITRDDIAVRTIVDLPQEQIRKLTLFCRREKISRAEAVRRAVDRFLRGSPASDLRSFFGASRTRGKISKHVARLRQEWHKRRPAREDFRS